MSPETPSDQDSSGKEKKWNDLVKNPDGTVTTQTKDRRGKRVIVKFRPADPEDPLNKPGQIISFEEVKTK